MYTCTSYLFSFKHSTGILKRERKGGEGMEREAEGKGDYVVYIA
jgi:hypothetical protein